MDSMKCAVFFFYENETNYQDLTSHMKNLREPYQIITNNYGLNNYLKKIGKNSFLLGDIMPDTGKIGKEVYDEAKKILRQYRNIFNEIKFKDIEVFTGFEYNFLLRLTLLIKAKKILKKRINTIFIFENFQAIYFSILKLSQSMGYLNNSEINYVHGYNLEEVTINEIFDEGFSNRFASRKSVHYLKNTLEGKISLTKFKVLSLFTRRIFSLFIQKFTYQYLYGSDTIPMDKIINKIRKKISKVEPSNKIECLMFITAVRLDLYLRPILPILNKFKQEKRSFCIITSDLATGLAFSNQKVSAVNIFEEVNLLASMIRKSKNGKKIIAHIEKMLSSDEITLGLSEMVPEFLNRIYRSLAILHIFDHLICPLKVKSVIAAATGEMLENLSIEICKKNKIPSFSIIPGIPTASPYFADWYHADRIFVNGTQGEEILKNLGYEKERIHVTGNPKYDYFKTIIPKKSRQLLSENYDVHRNKKLLVIGMARWHKNDEIWMSNLINFCDKNDFEIIIKVHPTYKNIGHGFSEEKINAIKERCKNLRFYITYDMDLNTLLSGADLIITEFSSIGLEAILLEKPLILVNFLKQDFDPTLHYHKFNAALYTQNYGDLEKLILEVLKEDKHHKMLEEGRKKIANLYNFQNDGKATDRVYDVITSHM